MNDERLQLLLVDDDEDDFAITRDKLAQISRLSYDLKWANTYETAVLWLTNNQYALCITDYNLRASKTGLDLVEEMTSKGSLVPFIVLTGQGTLALCIDAGRRGAVDFLDKGTVTPEELGNAIQKALNTARTADTLRKTAEQLRRVSGD